MDDHGFLDIETPMLTKPRRKARVTTWCLLVCTKVILRTAAIPTVVQTAADDVRFDRYYQIVKCFRDEDLRADRHLNLLRSMWKLLS